MVAIRESLIPAGNSNRPGLKLAGGGPRFITIHETANPSPGADAEMHRRYTHGAGGWGGGGHPADARGPAYEGVSFHYAVDDREAVRLLPDDEVAWHAGDGADGPGNRRSVAIELCVNADGDADRARRHLVELVALLLGRHAIPLANVRMHRDWSGKHCPANLIATGAWPGLIAAIGALAGAAPPSPEAVALRRWAEATVPFAARGDLVREGTADLREFGGRRDERLALYQRVVAHRLNGANYVLTLDLWDRLRGEGKVALAR